MSLDNSLSLDQAVPKDSKYLTKDEVGEQGKNLTINNVSREELESDHGAEVKTVLHFTDGKPMVLNQTNKELLKVVLKAATVGDLMGKTVNVFNDPTVSFGGRVTGGIRIRKAIPGSDPAPNDNIPF